MGRMAKAVNRQPIAPSRDDPQALPHRKVSRAAGGLYKFIITR